MTAALGASLRQSPWSALLSDALASASFQQLEQFLEAERNTGAHVLPDDDQIFAAYQAVDPHDVRVVIVGQDPYPTPGHAHGLAFSYRGEGALPRSLGNIVRELERDVGTTLSKVRGDLTPWAKQGVLLLNAVLTVRAGEAGSHRGQGWEAFTRATLAALAAQPKPLVFVLWGRVAQRHGGSIGAHHTVLTAGHPSPLSVRYFRGCGHFSAINRAIDGPPIDWAAIDTGAGGRSA